MNNEQFYIPHSKRPGSEYDFANLQKLAQELNRTPLKFTNLEGQVMTIHMYTRLLECCIIRNDTRYGLQPSHCVSACMCAIIMYCIKTLLVRSFSLIFTRPLLCSSLKCIQRAASSFRASRITRIELADDERGVPSSENHQAPYVANT